MTEYYKWMLVLFIICSIIAIVFSIYKNKRYKGYINWPIVIGFIRCAYVLPVDRDEGPPTYKCMLAYDYKIDGQMYSDYVEIDIEKKEEAESIAHTLQDKSLYIRHKPTMPELSTPMDSELEGIQFTRRPHEWWR